MKVAIFENSYELVKRQFNTANKLYFKDKLEYFHFNSSNDFGNIKKIVDYDLIVMDISLSTGSDLDGIVLIESILKVYPEANIVVLTGQKEISEKMKSRGLPSYPIIEKPINFREVKDVLVSALGQVT